MIPGYLKPSAEWTASAQADNAIANPAKAAGGAGIKHYVTGVSYGYSAAPAAAKTVTVSDGTTTYLRLYLTTTDFGSRFVPIDPPLEIPANTAVSISLPASGTASVLGGGSIHGFSLPG